MTQPPPHQLANKIIGVTSLRGCTLNLCGCFILSMLQRLSNFMSKKTCACANCKQKFYQSISKMAAPLAVFDDTEDENNEEWPEFIDFRSSADVLNSNGDAFPVLSPKEEINPDNFGENRSISIEDLVNNFDDKLSFCFRNYNLNTERMAPVKILSQEEIMKNCK